MCHRFRGLEHCDAVEREPSIALKPVIGADPIVTLVDRPCTRNWGPSSEFVQGLLGVLILGNVSPPNPSGNVNDGAMTAANTPLFPPYEVMLSIDVVMIAAMFGIYLLCFVKRELIRKANAWIGISLLLAGLLAIVTLNAFDLYIMTLLPLRIGMMEAMQEMTALHITYSWYTYLVGVLLTGLGVYICIRAFGQQFGRLADARRAAEEGQTAAELLRKIAFAANHADNPNDAIRVCLDEVCAYSGWSVGHAYRFSPDGTGILISTSLWHLDDPVRYEAFRRETESTRISPGRGIAGRVIESVEPQWTEADPPHGVSARRKVRVEAGLLSGFAVPVMVGAQVGAVLEFFTDELIVLARRH